MKIKTVIFDLDGTLLDTLGDLSDSVNQVLAQRGFPLASEAQTCARVGHGIRRLITQSIPEDKRTEAVIDDCLDLFRTAYAARMQNRTQPYEGIVPLLRKLKEMGISVGVLSNKYELATKTLVRHYFGNLVQHAMGERPDCPPKPDPTSAKLLLRELGGDPQTTLYVGDSDTDMQTAHAAGLHAIGVTWGFRSPEVLRQAGAARLIDTPDALLPLIAQGVCSIDALRATFTKRGFGFRYFDTAAQATAYLRDTCAAHTVALGGSMTLKELGFPDCLAPDTEVHWHWTTPKHYKTDPDIYLTSANAISETGELVNIDGTGNRVACTLYGPQRCIFVCGINKLCADLPSAIERARKVAAPRNNQRLGTTNPCTKTGRCHDCASPSRICRALVVHMMPPGSMPCELVLIGQPLGY